MRFLYFLLFFVIPLAIFAQKTRPEDPFRTKFVPKNIDENEEDISLEDEDEESRVPITTPRPIPRRLYAKPTHEHLLYSIFPSLQKEKDWRKYCPANQYQFQVTCRPGKKLRYDLQLFCQQFSDMCGVPNVNLYPSRFAKPEDEGRPAGYGQKQKNGNFGIGRSWAFGLGAIPGFEFTSSQGADIGNERLPFFDQIGGMMLNYGGEVGVLGKRTGKGPARSLDSLSRGYPSLGLGQPTKADSQFGESVARALGVPSLNNVFQKLAKNSKNKKITGYEPGYGAVDPSGIFAIGKTDVDDVNLPGGFGAVEVIRGSGMGIGKK
ncbi:unnamed protein product [Caenorhabditis angaria]|uniref:Uncharacterized protein n=1 Tax=Caenorhabditis angaria TaxID=860376 RepID=A0A9P1MZH8_9PELO|nr:unnamed protein product [Caenorhabditis angaria]